MNDRETLKVGDRVRYWPHPSHPGRAGTIASIVTNGVTIQPEKGRASRTVYSCAPVAREINTVRLRIKALAVLIGSLVAIVFSGLIVSDPAWASLGAILILAFAGAAFLGIMMLRIASDPFRAKSSPTSGEGPMSVQFSDSGDSNDGGSSDGGSND